MRRTKRREALPMMVRLALVMMIMAAQAAPNVVRAQSAPPAASSTGEVLVQEVRIEGNHTTPVAKLPRLATRVGQPFDPRIVQEDVRQLATSRKFLDVKSHFQMLPGGVSVTFQVVERPTLQYVKFVGNQDLTTRTLKKKSELEVGGALDPYAVEEARRRIEAIYREKGYQHAQVTTVEGTKPGDKGAVFIINEGKTVRVLWTGFTGNTITNDARLRTQIKTKPGVLWLFGGKMDRKKLEEDEERLTAYYRSLGFFQAKVGHDFSYDSDKDWLSLHFVITEGPRYSIRNVSFIGNTKFENEQLTKDLELMAGKPFDQASLNRDLNGLRDVYGGNGYIFADIQADPRLLEEKPEVDLVYDIKEGKRYRVGQIKINVAGENPHTNHATILNRMSLRPGDIVDTRKLRDDERRLRFSNLFNNDPSKGEVPKIVFNEPKKDQDKRNIASRPNSGGSPAPDGYRGQSPDSGTQSGDEETVVDVAFVRDEHGNEQIVLTPSISGEALAGLDPSRARFQDPGYYGGASSRGHSYLPPGAQPLPANTVTSPFPATYGGRSTTNNAPVVSPPYTLSPRPTQMPAPSTPVYSNSFQGGSPPPGGMVPVPSYQPSYQPPVVQPPIYQPPTAPPPQGYAQPAPNYPPAGGTPGYAPVAAPVIRPAEPSLTPGEVPYQIMGGPEPFVDLEAQATETQTGRLMLGVGVNSDAGLVGNFVLDEQNFALFRVPRSWEDVRNGTAFRGSGQRFRIEANPGTLVQRYSVSFQEPYLFNTPVQLALSGFYFTRIYSDWNEERVGGRVGLGYSLTPDWTVRTGFRGEKVTIFNPTEPTPPELAEVVGDNDLYGFSVGTSHDTRDSPFLPTQGHLLSTEFEQVVGSFDYPRATVEGRQYFLLRQRADGSGRHVLGIGGEFGVSGVDTPIYDNFFAGGFSTLRGFEFRGASPRVGGVTVGGRLMLIGTAEYLFPITADDALRGVVFCDLGTVERDIEINADQFRVAPGFGLRITVPAMGPAPIALDFAFPVAHAAGDEIQNFSFFVGAGRSY